MLSGPLARRLVKKSASLSRGARTAQRRSFGTVMNLFESSKMQRVPLDITYLQGEPSGSATTNPAFSKPQTTTLANGLRVVSVDDGEALTSVGLFVGAGTRNEGEGMAGSAIALSQMPLASNSQTMSVVMNRALTTVGAQLSTMATRDTLSYQAECLRSDAGTVVNVLSMIAADQEFYPWEVDATRTKLLEQAEEYKGLVDENTMADYAHAAAFGGNALSYPTTPNERIIRELNSEGLKEYHSGLFTASNMVLAGVGIDHEELVALAENANFSNMDKKEAIKLPPAQYTGGDLRPMQPSEDGLAHVMLSFETGNWFDKSLAATTVLQMMMGGGASFSSGGPGKGMYSRLSDQVLNRYGFVQHASARADVYNDTGIMSLYGVTTPEYGSELISVLSEQAAGMAGEVNEVELQRAKNLVKSFILMHLEQRWSLTDDIGRAMLTYNEVKTAPELCAEIDAVTSKQIQSTAKKMLSSPVSITALGETQGLPGRDAIQGKITA